MRIIVSFDRGLSINFEDIVTITNDGDHLILNGGDIHIVVIRKSWLLTANEVYLDTRIEEG